MYWSLSSIATFFPLFYWMREINSANRWRAPSGRFRGITRSVWLFFFTSNSTRFFHATLCLSSAECCSSVDVVVVVVDYDLLRLWSEETRRSRRQGRRKAINQAINEFEHLWAKMLIRDGLGQVGYIFEWQAFPVSDDDGFIAAQIGLILGVMNSIIACSFCGINLKQ